MPGTHHGTLTDCTTPVSSSPGKDCQRLWLPCTCPALSRAPAQPAWLTQWVMGPRKDPDTRQAEAE